MLLSNTPAKIIPIASLHEPIERSFATMVLRALLCLLSERETPFEQAELEKRNFLLQIPEAELCRVFSDQSMLASGKTVCLATQK